MDDMAFIFNGFGIGIFTSWATQKYSSRPLKDLYSYKKRPKGPRRTLHFFILE